jgi:hypothetical protein
MAQPKEVKRKGSSLAEVQGKQQEDRVQEANYFELKGGSSKIIYSSTSFEGPPNFNYEAAAGIQSFKGDEIGHVDTEIGELVTVRIDRARGTTLTVLLPIFHVNLNQDDMPFTTWAITATRRRPEFGEAGSPVGALQTYGVDELQGIAQHRNF